LVISTAFSISCCSKTQIGLLFWYQFMQVGLKTGH